tara:strand:+ start:223 stop:414 length:192 start_codon:yes stop_codon:yes gene_type:complete
MPEPINNDAENTSKMHNSWLLADRVEYLEQVVAHLLESHKDMLGYFTEVVTAVKEISDGDSEE